MPCAVATNIKFRAGALLFTVSSCARQSLVTRTREIRREKLDLTNEILRIRCGIQTSTETVRESRQRSTKGWDWRWRTHGDRIRIVSLDRRRLLAILRSTLAGSMGLVMPAATTISTISTGLEATSFTVATSSSPTDGYNDVSKSKR
jgi:hypothetical protein